MGHACSPNNGLLLLHCSQQCTHTHTPPVAGEKQERVDELQEDLADMKATYRQQIDFMAAEITRLQQQQQQLVGAG